MILINISSDSVWLFLSWQSIFVSKKDVINNFNQELLKIVKKYNPKQCLVISWPWSFTTLRATALVINTLISTQTRTPKLYQTDKISFYQTLVKKWILPTQWIINIWQKNSMWQITYNQNWNIQKTIISKKTIPDLLKSDSDIFCFIEWLYEETLLEKTPNPLFFINSVINSNVEDWKWTLNYQYNWKNNEIDLSEFSWEQVELITPSYMIDAVK